MSFEIERITKPWGYELIWAKTEKYVGKILHIEKGKRLSFQYHQQKDETIFVTVGRLLVETEESAGKEKNYHLNCGECLHIPALRRHRFVALEECDVFEVSTPELDDVVRLRDDHGRPVETF